MADSSNSSPLETKSDFAKRLGVNKSTITRAAQQGRLVLNADGLVLINESIEKWQATQGARNDVAERHARERGHSIKNGVRDYISQPQAQKTAQPQTQQTTRTDEDEDLSATTETVGADRAQYKALKLRYENNILKLKEGLARGQVIEKEQLADQLNQKAKAIKSGLENLIDNLSPQLGNAKPTERKALFETELQKIKDNLNG